MEGFDISEDTFDRLSEEKQERLIIDLFRRIEDRGYTYGLVLMVYEREERERKEGKRKGQIININSRR